MGVAPIILSDDWIFPKGPDWTSAYALRDSGVTSPPALDFRVAGDGSGPPTRWAATA
jgi:hypothetical protein